MTFIRSTNFYCACGWLSLVRMNTLATIFAIFLFLQTDVPYLPEDEYNYEVEFFLKRKPTDTKEVYRVKSKENRPDVLPYIKLHFNFLKFEDTDRRIKVYREGMVFTSKKIKGPMKLSLDMGYSVDMKDGITPAAYTIYIFNKENEKRARIEILVKKNGELLINDKMSGMI